MHSEHLHVRESLISFSARVAQGVCIHNSRGTLAIINTITPHACTELATHAGRHRSADSAQGWSLLVVHAIVCVVLAATSVRISVGGLRAAAAACTAALFLAFRFCLCSR